MAPLPFEERKSGFVCFDDYTTTDDDEEEIEIEEEDGSSVESLGKSSILTDQTSSEDDESQDDFYSDNFYDVYDGDDNSPKEAEAEEPFRAGDHIYIWCHNIVYQHHGIVVKVNDDGGFIVADFTDLNERDRQTSKKSLSWRFGRHSATTLSSSCTDGRPGGFRFIQEPPGTHKWKRVKYSATYLERMTNLPGTCTRLKMEDSAVILARVNFLFMNQHLLPPYHVIFSNCEALAYWCCTGQWRTHQVDMLLNFGKALPVMGTGGAAAVAACETVTVPAAGLWGFFGYTTEVSLVAVQPWLLPAIAATGVVVGGATLWNAVSVRRKWGRISARLNKEFEPFYQDWQRHETKIIGSAF